MMRLQRKKLLRKPRRIMMTIRETALIQLVVVQAALQDPGQAARPTQLQEVQQDLILRNMPASLWEIPMYTADRALRKVRTAPDL